MQDRPINNFAHLKSFTRKQLDDNFDIIEVSSTYFNCAVRTFITGLTYLIYEHPNDFKNLATDGSFKAFLQKLDMTGTHHNTSPTWRDFENFVSKHITQTTFLQEQLTKPMKHLIELQMVKNAGFPPRESLLGIGTDFDIRLEPFYNNTSTSTLMERFTNYSANKVTVGSFDAKYEECFDVKNKFDTLKSQIQNNKKTLEEAKFELCCWWCYEGGYKSYCEHQSDIRGVQNDSTELTLLAKYFKVDLCILFKTSNTGHDSFRFSTTTSGQSNLKLFASCLNGHWRNYRPKDPTKPHNNLNTSQTSSFSPVSFFSGTSVKTIATENNNNNYDHNDVSDSSDSDCFEFKEGSIFSQDY